MTTSTTLRPDTAIRTSGSSIAGTGTFAGVLADDSDSNYLATFSPFTQNRVRFESLAVPSGALIYSVVLRLRSRRPFADGTIIAAGLNLRTGMSFTPGTAAFTTSASAPQPSFTSGDLAFGVSLEWTSSGPENIDLSEAYLDVVYVEKPTVDVTSPTGTIATTQPTIEWDTTGDYSQSNWQAKIFTQAQFDAPGFNPSTSTAFWNSGVQAGNAASIGWTPAAILAGGGGSVTPPQNLSNGGTYRYYVRAAQRVGSTTQWSDWDYEEVTVSATVPTAPTLTAVADNALARIKLTVTEADPWDYVTIQRTSDGTTWESVRSATRAATFGDTFVAYDYETGNGIDVQYRALAIDLVGDDDVASDWSSSTATVSWTSVDTWLKAPLNPTLNATVKINELPSLKRRLPQGTFDVAGRADPVTVADTRHLTEGSVTFAIVDTAALDAVLALLNLAEPLLLQTPPEDQVDLYIAVGDVDENRVSRRSNREERLVVCPFVEVLAPVGEIVGFGVTWQDTLDLYADWQAVLDANPTWLELLDL